jgi:type IV secretory pathway TraG/TraD family ATPase VirD4
MTKPTTDPKSNVSSKNKPDPHLSEDFSRTDSEEISEFLQHATDKHLITLSTTRTGKGLGIILPNQLNFIKY